jgi:hypothetical protein
VTVRRGALRLAGALALLSLGLPWAGTDLAGDAVVGGEHPMRVSGAAAAVLILIGVRMRRGALILAGLAVATAAVPIELAGGVGSGRIAYALAIAAILSGLRWLPTGVPTPPAPT